MTKKPSGPLGDFLRAHTVAGTEKPGTPHRCPVSETERASLYEDLRILADAVTRANGGPISLSRRAALVVLRWRSFHPEQEEQ